MAMSIWLNYFKEDQTQPIDIGTSSASYMIVLVPYVEKVLLKLADLMITYNLGVSTKLLYELKKIDTDYIEE